MDDYNTWRVLWNQRNLFSWREEPRKKMLDMNSGDKEIGYQR